MMHVRYIIIIALATYSIQAHMSHSLSSQDRNQTNKTSLGEKVKKDLRDNIKNDPPTNSLDLLDLILRKTANAYFVFNGVELNCITNCRTDPSSMKIVSLPNCVPVIADSHSIEAWFYNLQSNYNSLQVYQFYLDNYCNATLPKRTADNLQFVRGALPNFEIIFLDDVYERTCDYITAYAPEPPADPQPMPSLILEDARMYEFLRQFTEFLNCFHNLYAVFWGSFQILSC